MKKEITVSATIENVEQVTNFINCELDSINCPTKAKSEIDIAIDELFSNIAKYAYNPEIGKATVQIEITDNPPSVILVFMDDGKPFNPLDKIEPKIDGSLEEREIGGLGIFMVKKSMDNVEYEYKNNKNILKIKKNI